MNFFNLILSSLWFILPAAAANGVPPLAAKLWPRLSYPVDFGGRWRGLRIFGDHKTWRGLIAGTIAATVVYSLQCYFVPHHSSWGNSFNFYNCNFWLGPITGISALIGDLLKSFFKRRLAIKPGKPWVPWDQVDWLLGVLLFTYPYYQFSFEFMALTLLLGGLMSFAGKVFGYLVGINNKWI